MTEPLHALSFDVEDWFHFGVGAVNDPRVWDALPSVVERRTDDLLRVCAAADTRATFFVVGWIADRRPALVARILDAGHEVGSHSFWHRRVSDLDLETFRCDVRESVA